VRKSVRDARTGRILPASAAKRRTATTTTEKGQVRRVVRKKK
jgi:hypothetical protein